MWIDEYLAMMFPKNIKEMDSKAATALKYQHIPSSLYKYRSVGAYSLENLTNDELWFNSADKMNDPYDSSLTINQQVYIEDIMKKVLLTYFPMTLKNVHIDNVKHTEMENKSFNEVYEYILELDPTNRKELDDYIKRAREKSHVPFLEQLETIIKRVQTGTYISCFSERNDSILMWSHYTDNHQGFCLEYNFKKVGIHPALTEFLLPIIYREEMYDMSIHFAERMWNAENFNKYSMVHGVIVKSLEWAYEKEWRLISMPLRKESGFNLPFFPPEAIYLGSRISDEDKEKLVNIAEKKRLKVFQMKMKTNQFKLTSERIL